LSLNRATLEWLDADPDGLLAAARRLPGLKEGDDDPEVRRLLDLLLLDHRGRLNVVNQDLLDQLLLARPEALAEAVQILIAHREAVVQVMTRYGYTDSAWIGGYLDRDL